jgi:uncharacterized membrane protein YfcA
VTSGPTAAFLFSAAALGGGINAVAGGGSFVAFPALLFAGVAPVAANATNTIALWPGSVASAIAYRSELRNSRRELVAMGGASLVGGLAGSCVLLRTSNETFVLLVPWLLLFAALVFTWGGAILQRITRRGRVSLVAAAGLQLFIGIYGGYFGGGAGIMMLAVLSLIGMTDIHRMNAIKSLLATLINGVAVVAFLLAGIVAWTEGPVMIAGAVAGGYAGAAVGRRVRPQRVRNFVLGIAWMMTAYFFLRTYAGPLAR